ncbi:MAG: OmpA family protein [Leptospiraceae bacterium]|nr:OmpA family protein [Leptospiraceae bacterium]MCP5501153.1 OmpA family protein [Leptospiraceae bacterium]
MKAALKNAMTGVCPNFGALEQSIIPKKAIYKHPVEKIEYVAFLDHNGQPISARLSHAVAAKEINDAQELKLYIQEYDQACGKDSFPPFFKEITYVKNYIEKEKKKEVEEEKLVERKLEPILKEHKVNEKTVDGKTPLESSIETSDPELVKKVLKEHPDLKTKDGKSAVEVAKANLEKPENYTVGKLLINELGLPKEEAKPWVDQFKDDTKQKEVVKLLEKASGTEEVKEVKEVKEDVVINDESKDRSTTEGGSEAKESAFALPEGVTLESDSCKSGKKVSKGEESGRFSIGIGGKSLLFGYPFPVSTSHFIVRSDKHYAGNYTAGSCRVSSFSSKPQTGKESGGSETVYRFGDLFVKQEILPSGSESGKSVKIKYSIQNTGAEPLRTGLYILFDLMQAGSDTSFLYTGKTPIKKSLTLNGKSLEGKIHFKSLKKGSPMSFLSFKGEKPAALHVGNWADLYSSGWSAARNGKMIRDSSVAFYWKEKNLDGGASVQYELEFGTDEAGDGNLEVVYDASHKQSSVNLKYGRGNFVLRAEQKRIIRKQIKAIGKAKIRGIFVEGFTDAEGTYEFNSKLSIKRTRLVKDYLVKQGVTADKILLKNWGESYATSLANPLRNKEDRRVILHFISK